MISQTRPSNEQPARVSLGATGKAVKGSMATGDSPIPTPAMHACPVADTHSAPPRCCAGRWHLMRTRLRPLAARAVAVGKVAGRVARKLPITGEVVKRHRNNVREDLLARLPKDSVGAEIGVWKGSFS